MQSTMKLVYSLLVITYVLDLSAAVPIRWTVETSRVQPAQFEAYHGETLRFEATINGYENPFAITNDYISIYWQTNGMESTYWSAPAMISNNVMIAIWTPEMDAGAATYQCFIGAPGDIYRASFQLRLRPSPGVVPNELPLPVKMLDFAAIEVHNAPYYTRAETDAEIKSVANTTLEAANAYTDEHSGGVDTNTVIALANEAILTNETLIVRENDIRDKAWEGYTIDDVYTPGIKANTMNIQMHGYMIDGIYSRLSYVEGSDASKVSFESGDPQTAKGIVAAANAYTDSLAGAMTNVQFVYDAARTHRHDFAGNLYEATFPTGGTFVVTLPGKGGAEVEVAYHSSYNYGPGSSQFHHYYRSRTPEFPNMSVDVSGSRSSRTVTFEIGHYNPGSWTGRIAGPVVPAEFADPALVEYCSISLCPTNVELAVTTEQWRYGTNLVVRHVPMGGAQFVTPPYDRFATTNELAATSVTLAQAATNYTDSATSVTLATANRYAEESDSITYSEAVRVASYYTDRVASETIGHAFTNSQMVANNARNQAVVLANNYTDAATNALAATIPAPYTPDPTNPAFSNAVVSVVLPIGTNELAVLREIGELPIGEGATGLGAILAALAAAVAWLKRKTSEIESSVGAANADLEDALGEEAE